MLSIDGAEQVPLLRRERVVAALALLPGVFRVLELDFHASPAQLAGLVLAQSWLKGLAYPLWGHVADRRPRKPLLMAAAATTDKTLIDDLDGFGHGLTACDSQFLDNKFCKMIVQWIDARLLLFDAADAT